MKSVTETAIERANSRLYEYRDKQEAFRHLNDTLSKLGGDVWSGSNSFDAYIADINQQIDEIDSLFAELGCLPKFDNFDVDSYEITRIEREIGNRKIGGLDEIPDEYRDNFRCIFEGEGGGRTEMPRGSASIREDIGDALKELRCSVDHLDEFLTDESEQAEPSKLLNTFMDKTWGKYTNAVWQVASHFA